MKPCLPIVLGLALSAIAGCRTDPAIPLLERELYRKDKEINRLQWQIEDLQELLNSCPDQGASRGGRSDEGRPEPPTHDRHEPSGVRPPTSEMQGKPTSKMPDWMTKPRGATPRNDPDAQDNSRDSLRERSDGDGPALDGGSGRISSQPGDASTAAAMAASAIPFTPSGSSDQTASIQLDRMLTGGISSGDRSGDQGLLVVVEPRDRAGHKIDAPGDVNVAVLDPALSGEAARVARWDFSAAETASLFRRTGGGGAMHLAMAWPKNPPKHNKLHLFVRYLTADGRKLEINQPIEIALAGDAPARWMAADSSLPDDPPEHNPAPKSWRSNEAPSGPTGDFPAYVARRTSDSKIERPLWSPDRR